MPNISILQSPQSNNGTMITPSAGNNRLVLYSVSLYSATGVVMPESLTINGVAGIYAFGEAPGAVLSRLGTTVWYFKESDIAAISNKAVTIGTFTGTLDGREVTVLQDAFQGAPFAAAKASGSSGTLTAPLARDNNSFSITLSQSQNVNATLTLAEPLYTNRQAYAYTSLSYGYSADTYRTASATSTTNSNTSLFIANFKSIGANIVSINNGNPVEIGSAVPVTTTGFTGTPTATFNVAGISAAVSGSANNWTLTFTDRVSGAVTPSLPVAVTLTLTNGAEVATLSLASFTKKANETKLTYLGAVTGDVAYTSGVLTVDGFTVEGGEFYYVPNGATLFANGSWTTTSPSVVVNGWFVPAVGVGAGKCFAYTHTLVNPNKQLDVTTALLSNPQSPRFASNSSTGKRTLFPLKFTPDLIRSGLEPVGTIISGSTYPCVSQKTGPVAEGIRSYAASIDAGGYQPWGYRENFPAPKTKGDVINLQWSLYFPASFNWTGYARLKFMRITRRCNEFSYFRCSSGSGTVPANGTVITKGSATGTVVGITFGNGLNTTDAIEAPGTPLPATFCVRVTNVTGVFSAGTFTSGGITGTVDSPNDNGEGYIDIYMNNAQYQGAAEDGLLLLETENYGGINNGFLVKSTGQLVKDRWETVEIRVVLDSVPMSQGGTARIQLWKRVGQQMMLICDVQDTSTINRNTSTAHDMILFNYWNGGSPQTQTMYLDRMVQHFNPATLVETCSTTGVKIIGGVSP